MPDRKARCLCRVRYGIKTRDSMGPAGGGQGRGQVLLGKRLWKDREARDRRRGRDGFPV